jgi:hypothetical protein
MFQRTLIEEQEQSLETQHMSMNPKIKIFFSLVAWTNSENRSRRKTSMSKIARSPPENTARRAVTEENSGSKKTGLETNKFLYFAYII